ncbi:MAG: hypothetical protein AAGB00_06940 [Planctomycetota bacterium]
MHRMIEELPGPLLTDNERARPSYRDDVYRDDPYKFETDGEPVSFAKMAESDDLRRIDYLPSPDEIVGVCAAIRSQWTKSEKRRRFVGELPAEAIDDTAWAPPVIDTSHFRVASGAASEGV